MAATTYTYSEQHRPFPATGSTNTLVDDGSPLHSRLGIDMMLSCNNLGYSMPFAGFVHSYNMYGNHLGNGVSFYMGASPTLDATHSEWFAGQLPTVLPHDDAVRFCWTMGVSLSNLSDSVTDVEVDAVTVYLAGAPYTDRVAVPGGATTGIIAYGSTTAFDATKIASAYGTSSKATTITLPYGGGSDGYYLVDNSAGTTGTFLPFLATTEGGLSKVDLIVTATGHVTSGTTGAIGGEIRDFTWWILPE